jgi:hypothetical protein
MPKDERKKKVGGLFGLDPTLGIGDKVIDYVEQAQEKEKKRLQKSDYYTLCPNCGRKQVKKNLVENGCFICGWKGTEENIELARAKLQSGEGGAKMKNLGYKINCPNCDASVVTEEFLKNGCYRCGYKEKD